LGIRQQYPRCRKDTIFTRDLILRPLQNPCACSGRAEIPKEPLRETLLTQRGVIAKA
jgi:hypothetical protein